LQAIAPEQLTLAELFQVYLAQLPEGNLESSTIGTMKTHQRHFEERLGKDFLINGLTTSHLQTYIQQRSADITKFGRKVSAVTIKKAVLTLRTVWNWGRHHDLITKPYPSYGLRYPKGKEKPHFMVFSEVERRAAKLPPTEAAELWECVFLSLTEIAELLATIRQRALYPFIYPLFVFAAHTGARRSEIVRNKLTDLDFEAKLITIQERKKSHDKRTTRHVPMSPLLYETLQTWLARHPGGEYTFVDSGPVQFSRKRRNGPEPLTIDEARHHFHRALAGTRWEKLRGWHTFRHSFCSNCAASGVDQRVINAWVGHLSEPMVRRYRHLLPDQQRSAITTVFGEGNG
jgi:integrase